MAICMDCNQEMTTAVSCTVEVLHGDGVAFLVRRWGTERGWRRPRGRCGDCGVLPGGVHHLGCDIAECPRCRRQLITCGCGFDELGPVDADFHDDGEAGAGDDLDSLARGQTDLFDDLIALVGSLEALWALDTEPLPDEPFDWSAVEEQDVAFVGEVLARSDRCCDELLDAEFRTIARRLLVRVAARDPRVLRRRPDADRCAAALVWLAGRASGEFRRRARFRASDVWSWFGVRDCADRGRRLRRAAGVEPDDAGETMWRVLTVGDASLLHSRFRASIVRDRDALLEVARARRRWWPTRNGQAEVCATPEKVVMAFKGVVADGTRAHVIVALGDDFEHAHFLALTIPDAHELVRLVQQALDTPLPRCSCPREHNVQVV